MNILNLLTTKEKRVAGIEISDTVVRIAFLREQKNKRTKKMETKLVLLEESINEDIIAGGVVVNGALLAQSLRTIWNKARTGTDYAIVSIPDDATYSRVFSFPKGVEGPRLTEAVRLAISYQLPTKIESTYLDWERTAGTDKLNQILLSTIPKNIADSYIKALEAAGIKTLAIETHLAGIARAVKLPPGQATILTEKNPDATTIFIIKDGTVRFSRTLPDQFVPEKKIKEEIRRIKTAFESEGDEEVVEESLESIETRDDYAGYSELDKDSEEKSKWFVVLGAVIRGRIEEGKDTIISLLPVGTEEAYVYQRAASFMGLLRNLTIAVSAFFVLAFVGTHFFMLSILQSSSKASATVSETAYPPELAAKETLIRRVNALAETSQTLLSTTPLWSKVLIEIRSRIISGVIISRFTAPSVTDKMVLVGTAKDRLTLNQFKKSLQESKMFTEVDLPITNLEQKGNVPFTISFRLIDPSAIYYK